MRARTHRLRRGACDARAALLEQVSLWPYWCLLRWLLFSYVFAQGMPPELHAHLCRLLCKVPAKRIAVVMDGQLGKAVTSLTTLLQKTNVYRSVDGASGGSVRPGGGYFQYALPCCRCCRAARVEQKPPDFCWRSTRHRTRADQVPVLSLRVVDGSAGKIRGSMRGSGSGKTVVIFERIPE